MVFISLFYLCEVVTCLDIGLLPIGILAVKQKNTHKIDKTLLFNRKCMVFIH